MNYPKENGIKIEEVPSVPPEILEAASSGRLVVFIGAGVSRIIGCPSWKEFAIGHLKYLYNESIINYHEFTKLKLMDSRKILSICKNIYKTRNIQSPTENLLKCNDELIKKFLIYEELYSFNSIYITTNYDTFLDKVVEKNIHKKQIKINSQDESLIDLDIDEEKKVGKVFYKKQDILITNLENGNVIHFHGSVNDENEVVMTIVDYMNHYKPKKNPSFFLREVFEKYTVLFVGYGLEEYEIIEFMIKDLSNVKNEIRHFMLYPMFTKNDNLLKFYEDYYKALGIRLIPYSIDKKGYDQLEKVIKNWAKEIGQIAQPKGFYEEIKLIDEVI
jgi:hypothetical protein